MPNRRLLAFKVSILLGFLLLVAQTWNLQVSKGEFYRLVADRNRFRLISIPAPRGVIYDRQGRLLVRNVPSFTVSVVPADLPPEREAEVVYRLTSLLQLETQSTASTLHSLSDLNSADDIQELIAQGRATAPYAPLAIAYDVPRNLALVIQEEHLALPGVMVRVDSKRNYLSGDLTSHFLGYVGAIPQENAAGYLADLEKGYEPQDLVGLTGLELTFQDLLRGVKGEKHIEVDALGREIQTLGTAQEPVPGNNLILTIDLELQRKTAEFLKEGMANAGSLSGVAIAMDPRTGEILAMVSLPAYDNNLFVGNIAQEEVQALLTDPNHPLVNHALSGLYPPGSTFKLVIAPGALEEGVVTTSTRIQDRGVIWIPNRYAPDDHTLDQPFYDWVPTGHGWINFTEAIAQSCDIYFYLLAGGYHGRDESQDFEELGREKVAEYSRLFGYGQPSGIELPGEAAGLIPDAQWKRETYGEPWSTGDTYNMAIGQGFVLSTPLQVLNTAVAVANGGTLLQPQIVREVRDTAGNIIRPFQVKVIRELPISPENIEAVRQGMRAAVNHGTAFRSALLGVAVAGKTGSAEYPGPRDEEGNLPTHAWFVGFAPADNPEIAVVVFLEGGGRGSQTAAPIAAQIMAAYFSPESE